MKWANYLGLMAIGGAGGVVVLLLGSGLLWFFVENIPEQVAYGVAEKGVQNDPTADLVAELCGTHKDEMGKVDCVMTFFDNHYNYTPHNGTMIRPASEFISIGGVCRDFAVNACATVKKMGIVCSYGFGRDHVYPIVQFSEGEKYVYCIYDGMWWCK